MKDLMPVVNAECYPWVPGINFQTNNDHDKILAEKEAFCHNYAP